MKDTGRSPTGDLCRKTGCPNKRFLPGTECNGWCKDCLRLYDELYLGFPKRTVCRFCDEEAVEKYTLCQKHLEEIKEEDRKRYRRFGGGLL